MHSRFAKPSQIAAVLLLIVCAAPVLSQQLDEGTVETRLAAQLSSLGFPGGKIPLLQPAFGNYVDAVRTGNLLYLSSAAPQRPDGQFVKGRVPEQVSVDDAMVAARLACVRQIARLQLVLGDLRKVRRIVYVRGKIWSHPDFTDQTKVTDACSALFVNVFGERGRHARTSEGVAASPFGATVEIETLVDLEPLAGSLLSESYTDKQNQPSQPPASSRSATE